MQRNSGRLLSRRNEKVTCKEMYSLIEINSTLSLYNKFLFYKYQNLYTHIGCIKQNNISHRQITLYMYT